MIKRLPMLATALTVMLLVSLPARSDEWHYIVKPGDNLWTISERYLPDVSYVKKLQTYNSITNPYRIPPGSTVRIPLNWLKSQASSANVVDIEGNTFVQRSPSQQKKPLTVGEQLGVKDKIITSDHSSAVIEFKDGSRVLIHNNTELHFERVEHYPDSNFSETELLLERGRVETEVPKKSTGKSIFKIRTPSASTAVRGTFLRTGSRSAGINPEKTLVEVLRGRVSVSGSKFNKQVKAGYGIVISEGKPPNEAVPLLDAPKLIKPPVFIDRLSTTFLWNNINGNRGYRVQIFTDQVNPKLVWNIISTANRMIVPDLPDGQYTMKLHAIDTDGLEGKDTLHHCTLDARPEPPIAASPGGNTAIESARLKFHWSLQDHATGYHLQLSRQQNFDTLLIDQIAEGSKGEYVNQLQLQPGTYYWRIATQTSNQEGPFNLVQTFKIIPPVPQALEPQGDNETLIFRWQKGDPTLQYQVQLANNKEFTDIVLDKHLTEPRLEVKRPTNSRLYLRMRPVVKHGSTGNWSHVQYVDPADNKPWYLLMFLPLLLLILLL